MISLAFLLVDLAILISCLLLCCPDFLKSGFLHPRRYVIQSLASFFSMCPVLPCSILSALSFTPTIKMCEWERHGLPGFDRLFLKLSRAGVWFLRWHVLARGAKKKSEKIAVHTHTLSDLPIVIAFVTLEHKEKKNWTYQCGYDNNCFQVSMPSHTPTDHWTHISPLSLSKDAFQLIVLLKGKVLILVIPFFFSSLPSM